MTAYEIPGLRFALESAGVVARRRFVKADAAGKGAVAGAGESAIGVSINSTAAGETLEIADGIVMVEAGGVVAANAVVQSAAAGKAVALTTGIPLGTALTSAAGAGELIAVKTPCAGSVGDVTFESNVQVVSYQVEDLAAGVDIASRPIFIVPVGYTFDITAAQIIMQGASAGIDDDNLAAVSIELGGVAIAAVEYDTAGQPAASGAAGSLGTITEGLLAAGDVLQLSVTQGVAADLPAFVLQVTGTLAAV